MRILGYLGLTMILAGSVSVAVVTAHSSVSVGKSLSSGISSITNLEDQGDSTPKPRDEEGRSGES